MKSTYSFPSTSQTRDPRPRSSTTGPAEYTAAPRDGEFTPSMSDRCARSYHSRDRSRLVVFLIFAIMDLKTVGSNRARQASTVDNQRGTRHKRRRIAGQI